MKSNHFILKRYNEFKSYNDSNEINEHLLGDALKWSKEKLQWALKGFYKETKNNKEMLNIFWKEFLHLLGNKHNTSDEDVKNALKQLKNIPQYTLLASAFLLIPIPMAGVLYIIIAKTLEPYIYDKLKIHTLPKSFRE